MIAIHITRIQIDQCDAPTISSFILSVMLYECLVVVYTYIVDISILLFSSNGNCICTGVEYHDIPDTKGVPIVCDMSSNILSKEIDVSKVSFFTYYLFRISCIVHPYKL